MFAPPIKVSISEAAERSDQVHAAREARPAPGQPRREHGYRAVQRQAGIGSRDTLRGHDFSQVAPASTKRSHEPTFVHQRTSTPQSGDGSREADPRTRALEVTQGPGALLPPEVQHDAALRFGHSFADVRVHTDEKASGAAKSFHAAAFTIGNHIVFGAGRYSPASPRGRLLLQHELRHVEQQRHATRVSRPELDPSHSVHERQAHRPFDASTQPLSVQRIQRAPEDAEFSLGGGMADSVGRSVFGDSVWPFVKAVFEGFVGGIQSDVKEGRAAEAKDHLSKLLRPWNAAKFYAGYVVGLVIGLVSPITDLVKGIIGVVKLGYSALEWLAKWSPAGVAMSAERQQKIVDLMRRFSDLSLEFGKALSDFVLDPRGTVKKFSGFLEKLMQMALGKARELGATAAHSIFGFLKKEFYDMGQGIGEVIGMLVAQVLLLVFSSAIGNLISKGASFLGKAAEFVAGKAVQVFEWVKGFASEVMAILRNAVKGALKLFEGLINKAVEAFDALVSVFSESAILDLGGERVAAGVGRGAGAPASNFAESRMVSGGRTSPATVADLTPPKTHPSNVGKELPKRPDPGKAPSDEPLTKVEKGLTRDQLRQKQILEDIEGHQEHHYPYTEREFKTSVPERTRAGAGMAAKPKHHVFPDTFRESYFEKRGFTGKYDIDNFTVELEQWSHEAIHPDWRLGQATTFEWNNRVMSELRGMEAKLGRDLSRAEIIKVVEDLMKQYRIPKKYVPYTRKR